MMRCLATAANIINRSGREDGLSVLSMGFCRSLASMDIVLAADSLVMGQSIRTVDIQYIRSLPDNLRHIIYGHDAIAILWV